VSDRHPWRDAAACRGRTTAKWFAPDAVTTNVALTVCRSCPVRLQCLGDALAHETGDRVAYGARGGFTAAQRIEMIRPRPRVEVAVVVEVELVGVPTMAGVAELVAVAM
jgi:WhiB family transcriptional regulator, redox-sensing transcriptional regulator